MRKAKSVHGKTHQHAEVARSAPAQVAQPQPSTVFDGEPVGTQWPDAPAEEAYYGLAGGVARVILPHTRGPPDSRVIVLWLLGLRIRPWRQLWH